MELPQRSPGSGRVEVQVGDEQRLHAPDVTARGTRRRPARLAEPSRARSGNMCGHVRASIRHALRPEPDRCPAPRQRAHGAVQRPRWRARAAAGWCCASRTRMPSAATRRCSQRLLEDLRWLGLEWAEGPDVGRPAAARTARASARDHYAQRSRPWRPQGRVYPCFCSPEELEAVAPGAARRRPAAALCGHLRGAAADGGGAPHGGRSATRAAVSRAGGPQRRVRRPDPRPAALCERRHRRLRDPPRRRQRRVLPRQRRRRRGDGHHARAAR